MKRAGAAHAAHHLVEDEQGAVTVADLPHRPEVAFGRRHAAGGGSDDGLGNESGHRVGAEAPEFSLQFGGQPRRKPGFGFIVALFAIRECRCHMTEGGRQQGRIGFAAPRVSARGQRAQGIPVVALPAGDETLALRLAAFDEILARQLDAGFDRFRSAADQVGVAEAAGLIADEQVGQRFGRLRREKAGMGISQFRRLPGNGLARLDAAAARPPGGALQQLHGAVRVAQAGNGGTAGAIENPAPILGSEPNAVAADRYRGRFAQASMQHAAMSGAHHIHPFSATYCDIAARRASVSLRRRFAPAPPSANVTAASDCAIAIAPVRLGKKPGEAAASNRSR